MKYTLSNTINKPLDEVAAKMGDPESVKHWMEGLQKIEDISGTPGEVGARRNHHFLYKKKMMVITETLLENNLPNQIKFAYDSPMGGNVVEMIFEPLSDHEVRQTTNTTMELKGAMKLMGVLFKGMFKKQSMKYMNDFKRFVEKG